MARDEDGRRPPLWEREHALDQRWRRTSVVLRTRRDRRCICGAGGSGQGGKRGRRRTRATMMDEVEGGRAKRDCSAGLGQRRNAGQERWRSPCARGRRLAVPVARWTAGSGGILNGRTHLFPPRRGGFVNSKLAVIFAARLRRGVGSVSKATENSTAPWLLIRTPIAAVAYQRSGAFKQLGAASWRMAQF